MERPDGQGAGRPSKRFRAIGPDPTLDLLTRRDDLLVLLLQEAAADARAPGRRGHGRAGRRGVRAEPGRPDVARRRPAVAAHGHARHRRHPDRPRIRRPRRGPGRDHRRGGRQLPLRRRRLRSTRCCAPSTAAWSRACWPGSAATTPAPSRWSCRRPGPGATTPAPPWSDRATVARHYLDHASTTPLRPEAARRHGGVGRPRRHRRPGRVHTEGRMVRAALEDARDQVAALFGVRPRQVVLTSGGTEAVNAAVWGVAPGGAGPAPVACAAVEHSAVRDASARRGPDGGDRGRRRRADHRGRGGRGASSAAVGSTVGRRSWCTVNGPTTRWAPSRTPPRWWPSAGRRECPSTSTRWRRPATCRSTSARWAPTWCRCRRTSSVDRPASAP